MSIYDLTYARTKPTTPFRAYSLPGENEEPAKTPAFLTVESLGSMTVMTGLGVAAWKAIQNRGSGVWDSDYMALLVAAALMLIATAPTLFGPADIGKRIQTWGLALINTFLLWAAILGTPEGWDKIFG